MAPSRTRAPGPNQPCSIAWRTRKKPPSASAIPPAQTTHCVPKRSSRLALGLGGFCSMGGATGVSGSGGGGTFSSAFASGSSAGRGSQDAGAGGTGAVAGASPASPASFASIRARRNSRRFSLSRLPSVMTKLTMASTGKAITTAMRVVKKGSINLAAGKNRWKVVGRRNWCGGARSLHSVPWSRPHQSGAYLAQGRAQGEAEPVRRGLDWRRVRAKSKMAILTFVRTAILLRVENRRG